MEKTKRSFTAFFTAKNVTYLAILTALIIVLQCLSGFFAVGATRLSFVLVPIVLGGMLLGVGAGAFLGTVFGLVVIFDALGGLDPFTLILLQESPVFTVALCLVKGAAAGAVSALVYKLIAKKNKYVAAFVASAVAPVVNTGIFVLGGLMIGGILSANFIPDGQSVIYFLIVGCAGINFIIEFAISLVLSPALYTVNGVVEKQIVKKKKSNAGGETVSKEEPAKAEAQSEVLTDSAENADNGGKTE